MCVPLFFVFRIVSYFAKKAKQCHCIAEGYQFSSVIARSVSDVAIRIQNVPTRWAGSLYEGYYGLPQPVLRHWSRNDAQKNEGLAMTLKGSGVVHFLQKKCTKLLQKINPIISLDRFHRKE